MAKTFKKKCKGCNSSFTGIRRKIYCDLCVAQKGANPRFCLNCKSKMTGAPRADRCCSDSCKALNEKKQQKAWRDKNKRKCYKPVAAQFMSRTGFKETIRRALPDSEIVYLSPRKYVPSEDPILAEVYRAYEKGRGYPFQRRRADGGLDYLFRVAA